ncbi:phytoene desaturase family protein [Bacteroidota bacterium]
MKLNIAIIGSGIGGLAVAIRLAVRGHDVTVFEQLDRPGGMIQQKRWEGFRWDTGPSFLLMPDQVEELYLLAGEEMKMSIRNHLLEQIGKYFFADGLILDAYGDPNLFAKEINEKTGEPAARIENYLNKLRKRYEYTRKVLTRDSLSTGSVFAPGSVLSFMAAWKNDYFSTAHDANNRRFKSKHVVQLFDNLASSQGDNPFAGPATLNLHANFIHNLGVYFPEKGMYRLTEELYLLAQQMGVVFKFNSRVDQIDLNKQVVKGITTKDDVIKADIVISDIDAESVYYELLPHSPGANLFLEDDYAASEAALYWAVDKEFPELCWQNLFMSANPKQEFEDIHNKGVLNIDPSFRINISSKLVSRDAPGGNENWKISVNVPANSGQQWQAGMDELRKKIIERINQTLQIDIEKHILQEFRSDPTVIEKETYAIGGNIYGKSNNRKLSAFRKHPNSINQIHGLYFVGRTVHPGGGLPMCLSSAKNVDYLVVKHYTFGR